MYLSSWVARLGCVAAVLASPLSVEERSYSTCQPASSGYLQSVAQQLYVDRIIPDLVERITPSVKVNVAYGTKQVDLGTYFTTTQTLTAPNISITAEPGRNPKSSYYSVFLIDPDVPENGSPVQVNFCHYIISHLQPSCISSKAPNVTLIYEPLTPASTTQHRYTFLVYREPQGYQPNTLGLQVRTPFDINDYAQDYGLVLVGANFLKEAISNGLQG